MTGATFEWDEEKDKENQKKHHVSFGEAQHAFLILIVALRKTLPTVLRRAGSIVSAVLPMAL